MNPHDEEVVEYVSYPSARKAGKPLGCGAPHYPNKAERVLLTQMMQKSGMTEEEIRKDKSNRIKLSAAQKSTRQRSGLVERKRRYDLLVKRAKRKAAAALGVPVWDKKVDEYINNTSSSFWGSIMANIRRQVYGR